MVRAGVRAAVQKYRDLSNSVKAELGLGFDYMWV